MGLHTVEYMSAQFTACISPSIPEVTWISMDFRMEERAECCIRGKPSGSLCSWLCSQAPVLLHVAWERHSISMATMFLYFKAGWKFLDCFSGVRRDHMEHSSNNGYSGPLSFGTAQHLDTSPDHGSWRYWMLLPPHSGRQA